MQKHSKIAAKQKKNVFVFVDISTAKLKHLLLNVAQIIQLIKSIDMMGMLRKYHASDSIDSDELT